MVANPLYQNQIAFLHRVTLYFSGLYRMLGIILFENTRRNQSNDICTWLMGNAIILVVLIDWIHYILPKQLSLVEPRAEGGRTYTPTFPVHCQYESVRGCRLSPMTISLPVRLPDSLTR